MKMDHIIAHMKTAHVYSQLSYCKRRKVGCIIVKDDRVISIGYNGTPPGWENVCEDCNKNTTKPETYHAEANAIAKLAKSGESGKNAVVFCTCTPCFECAKLLAQIEVKEVFYSETYHKTEGINFLNKCDIPTIQISVPVEHHQTLSTGQRIGVYIDRFFSKIGF